MLQWYREDPGSGGEFLGVLRLTAQTSIDLERGAGPLSRGETRLKVKASGETLVPQDHVTKPSPSPSSSSHPYPPQPPSQTQT